MSEDINTSWLKSVLKDNDDIYLKGIQDVLDIKTSPGVGKNENSTSDMIRLDVSVKLISGQTTTKSFMYKKRNKGAGGDIAEKLNIYETESVMYSKFLKEMTTLSSLHDETPYCQWPACYGFLPDVLLLQNLKVSGFRTIEKRSTGMDWEHSSLVVKGLAKFHALSAVLLEQGSIKKNDLNVSLFLINHPSINNIYINGLNDLSDSVLKHWGEEWKDAAKRLRLTADNIGEKLKALGEKLQGKFDVLNHGDSWTNNFMFKFDERTNIPLEFMFIDFQISHINNFAWDLTYFFYNCLLPDYRRSTMNKLLDLYTQDLSEHCIKYGFKGEMPSRQFVQQCMDDMMLYGLISCVTSMPMLLFCDKRDFEFDFDQMFSDNKGSPFQSHNFSDPNFISIMKRELEFFMKENVM